MKRFSFFFALSLLVLCMATSVAQAAQDAPKQGKRARSLVGAPVNVSIAGAGSLPKGRALTMINASFADKNHAKRGGKTDIFSQTWLAKFRYGITDRLEIAVTGVYVNNARSGTYTGPEHVEGFSDTVVQFTVSPLQQHQGDFTNLSFTAGVMTPTGLRGKNHLPGNGVWGGRMAAGFGGFITRDAKLDTEVVWSGPFARGNQKVRRGDQYQWNANARYLFNWIDIGLESTLTHQVSGDKSTPYGNVNTRNGYTEWLIGPSTNVALDSLGMWAGVGAFFPVLQDVRGPSKVEDVRYEFKIGKVW
jgi:hypothetical protein